MKRFNGWTLIFVFALLAAQGLLPGAAYGTDSVTVAEEFARKVTAAQSVSPLGNDLFGDQTDWYTGQTNFTVIDVDLPGNHALPVRVTRTRSTAPPEGPDTRELLGDWDLEVPYMSGVFRKDSFWVPTNRCSTTQAGPPNTTNGSVGFTGTEYSRGNFISIPGYGRSHVLWPDPAYTIRPQNGQTYRWVTASHIQLRCLSSLASGQSGEGFEAITPDGVRYTFNWMVALPYSKYSRAKVNGTGFDILDREEVRLYATRVEDRFGNYVNYSYTGARLTKIESNDGRVINLSYNAQNKLSSVTAHGRTWNYGYSNGRLSSVTLPDGSEWSYSTSSLMIVYYSQPSASTPCHLPPLSALSSSTINMGNQGWTMTHPSGATAVFRFSRVRHLRTNITLAQSCRYINGEGFDRFGVSKEFDSMALVSKTLTGPGIPATTWTASYGATSNNTKLVVNTNPDGSAVRHTFGTEYYRNEGKPVRVEMLSPGGAVISNTQTTYAIAPSSPAYAYRVGKTGAEFEDAFSSTIVTAVTNTSITQNGTTFTTSTPVASHDSLARPLSVVKSNTAGATRTDAIAYHDDQVRWVLGQVKSVTNLNTGLVESSTDFHASTALPHKSYSFGLLQQTLNLVQSLQLCKQQPVPVHRPVRAESGGNGQPYPRLAWNTIQKHGATQVERRPDNCAVKP